MDFHAIDHLLISDKAMRSFLERNMYQSLSYALRSVRFIEAWVSISHTTTWNARWWWWWEWSRQLTQTETFCQCDYVARHIVGIVCWIFCLLLLLPLPQPLPLLLIRFWLLLRKTDCGKTKWKRKKTHNTNRAQTASIERPQAKRFFYFFVILFLSLSFSVCVLFCSMKSMPPQWRSKEVRVQSTAVNKMKKKSKMKSAAMKTTCGYTSYGSHSLSCWCTYAKYWKIVCGITSRCSTHRC